MISALKAFMEAKTPAERAQTFLIPFRMLNLKDFRMCSGATRKRTEIMAFSCEVRRENVRLAHPRHKWIS